MSDYGKKTVAELQEILKGRSLPHTGKKAELVARLNEADKSAETKTGMFFPLLRERFAKRLYCSDYFNVLRAEYLRLTKIVVNWSLFIQLNQLHPPQHPLQIQAVKRQRL